MAAAAGDVGPYGGGGTAPRVGATFQFIGEVERGGPGGAVVHARVSRDVTGLDVQLYEDAMRMRREMGYP